MASLREGGNAVAAFLVEYVVFFVVGENLVEVEVACDTDDLAAGVTAVFVVAVAFAGVVFHYDYVFCVAFDVVALASYIVLFVVVAFNDAGVLAAAHVDVGCLRNNF